MSNTLEQKREGGITQGEPAVVFVDFADDGDFQHDQFRTRLKKSGYFQSGENAESKALYFGSRDSMLGRLYVKNVEIAVSGKDSLRTAWQEKGCGNRRSWRLEFENCKECPEEVAMAGSRKTSCVWPLTNIKQVAILISGAAKKVLSKS